jgi:hypothetical protein
MKTRKNERLGLSFSGRLQNRLLTLFTQIPEVVIDTSLYAAFSSRNTRANLFDFHPASLLDGTVLHGPKLAGYSKLSKMKLYAGLTFY